MDYFRTVSTSGNYVSALMESSAKGSHARPEFIDSQGAGFPPQWRYECWVRNILRLDRGEVRVFGDWCASKANAKQSAAKCAYERVFASLLDSRQRMPPDGQARNQSHGHSTLQEGVGTRETQQIGSPDSTPATERDYVSYLFHLTRVRFFREPEFIYADEIAGFVATCIIKDYSEKIVVEASGIPARSKKSAKKSAAEAALALLEQDNNLSEHVTTSSSTSWHVRTRLEESLQSTSVRRNDSSTFSATLNVANSDIVITGTGRRKQTARQDAVEKLKALLAEKEDLLQRSGSKVDALESHERREYQSKLIEKGLEQNIIVCLPTGSGKTFIATQIIKRHPRNLEDLAPREHLKPKCLSAFIVPTVVLTTQQSDYLRRTMELRVRHFYGDMGVDVWSKDKWYEELRDADVIVTTPQVLLDLLRHAVLSIKVFLLLVFDECHHCNAGNDHPYSLIMKEHYLVSPPEERPRILGLSAIPVTGTKLENVMNANLFSAPLEDFEILRHERIIYYQDAVNPIASEDYLQQRVGELGASAFDAVIQGRKNDVVSDDDFLLKTLHTFAGRNAGDNDFLSREGVISPQVRRVIEFVQTEVISNNDTSSGRVIIFVTQKITAVTLAIVLQMYFLAMGLDLRVDYLTGQRRRWNGTAVEVNEEALCLPSQPGVGGGRANKTVGMSIQRQKLAVHNFKQGITDILVSTSVGEEGLDIPACKFVVLFDGIQTAAQYIQRCGRARVSGATVVTMVNESNEIEVLEKLNGIKTQVDLLKRKVHDVEEEFDTTNPERTNEEGTTGLEFVTESGAKLTEASAISLLYRACQAVVKDPYCDASPRFIPPSEEELKAGLDPLTYHMFVPMAVPIQNHLVSGSRFRTQSIKSVKQRLAFEICKQLYLDGILDENLTVPKVKEASIIALQKEELRENLIPVCVDLKIPSCLQLSAIFAHTAESRKRRLTSEAPATFLTVIDIEGKQRASLGIVSSSPFYALASGNGEQESSFHHYMATKDFVVWKSIRLRCTLEGIEALRELHKRWLCDLSGQDLSETGGEGMEIEDTLQHGGSMSRRPPQQATTHRCCDPSRYLCVPVAQTFSQRLKNIGCSRVVEVSEKDLMQSLPPLEQCASKALIEKICYDLECFAVTSEACRGLDLSLDPVLARMALTSSHKVDLSTEEEEEDNSYLMGSTFWNYERLEFLGDSVLKVLTSVALFKSNPNWRESQLTSHRSKWINNRFLKEKVQEVGLSEHIVCEADKKSWHLPLDSGSCSGKKEARVIKSKTVADVAESLIGASYLAGGLDSAQHAIRNLKIFAAASAHTEQSSPNAENSALRSLGHLAIVQDTIGYTFKNPSLLICAFTHASNFEVETLGKHPGVDNNERLEFLGDALLSLLVAEAVYEKYPSATPEMMHNLTRRASCNQALGCTILALELHQFLRHCSSDLDAGIMRCGESAKAMLQEAKSHKNKKVYPAGLCDEECPKPLGDLLEAIIAAIYLDLNYDFEGLKAILRRKLWDVMLCWLDVDLLVLDPVSVLFTTVSRRKLTVVEDVSESAPFTYKFEIIEHNLCVDGIGDSKRTAKRKASRKALDALAEHGITISRPTSQKNDM